MMMTMILMFLTSVYQKVPRNKSNHQIYQKLSMMMLVVILSASLMAMKEGAQTK